MLLSDDLLYAIDPLETSYIEFKGTEAKDFFEWTFSEEWHAAVVRVVSEYYTEDRLDDIIAENKNPLTTHYTADGFIAVFEPMYIIDEWGARAWVYESTEALENTLKRTEEEYPNVSYSGCIQYFYSDTHSGDFVKFEVNADKLHPFIGEALSMAMKDENFWEQIEDCDDLDALKEEIMLYEDYLTDDEIDRIEEL